MRAIDNSRTAGNDGLGNANAGTVNTAFDDMQAKTDTFHPVNPNSEQRIMNDQQRAPSEVPTVNPDTGKNIGKTVSTILNSPLTSPEMATQIESAVADGQFDYIPVTDKDAHLKAQQDLSNRGLQTVADSFIAKVELGQRVTKNDTASAIAAYNQAVADGNHALAFDLMTAGIIQGDGSDPTGNGDIINLTHEQVRTLVFVYRGGGFDRKLRASGLAAAVQ